MECVLESECETSVSTRSGGKFRAFGGSKSLLLVSFLHLLSLCQSQTIFTEHELAVSKQSSAADCAPVQVRTSCCQFVLHGLHLRP